MICLKNFHKISFGIFLLACSVVLSGLLFFTTNVSAVEPISVSSSSVVNNSPLFSDCSSSSCLNQYSWLHVHTDTFGTSTNYFQLSIRFPNTVANTGDFRVYVAQSDAYYYIGGITSLRAANGFFTNRGDSVVTFSLLESLPAPDCPVCEVCPVIPENPYDDKFDAIIVAIYSCGAILLVIYFFYCFYRLFIHFSRGRS